MSANSSNGFPVLEGVTVFALPPDGYATDLKNPAAQSALAHFLVFGIAGSLALIALCQLAAYAITHGKYQSKYSNPV
ncbi:hypothetical protein MGG_16009 [Pyricularia oryzae 70-15]|uniref:Uncharacterized protein n=3 Tax=Pyricularia oryzae TaxID=318829 RepID=G4MMU6_PYRO7|nr:uncharacterized protein MGG_16009 [Pyricularia oryzae 70-15]EHA56176.1 hypothetical protein MGG_16009 [Pyricularia oryzae 70-15]ELQ40569.1 hypothetical protein OOU_Y34scaffold00416g4 [Pyricularia oryzae Y34]